MSATRPPDSSPSGWMPGAGSDASSAATADLERWYDEHARSDSLASSRSRAPLKPGDAFGEGGRIEIQYLVDVGGQGWVYRGWHVHLARPVALKVFQRGAISDPDRHHFLQLFRKEAAVSALLRHPQIVEVYDAGVWESTSADGDVTLLPYLVLEWLEGETLSGRLRRVGRLAPDEAVQVLLPVARALAFAHERRIVHRDLKPHNVFLLDDGRVKLLDFGLCVLVDDLSAEGPTNAQPGLAESLGYNPRGLGTPPYMAPEQRRRELEDSRTDVYSTGLILLEMLTGCRPISAPAATRPDGSELPDPPEAPLAQVRALGPPIPGDLTALLERALAPEREQRFADGQRLLEALEAVFATYRPPATAPPFRYLAPFTEEDGDWFFGRERILGRLEQVLREHPLVAVLGPSGSGKSSLVRAGLIPRLRRRGRWRVLRLRPGARPFHALAAPLSQLRPDEAPVEPDALAAAPGLAGQLLRSHALAAGESILLFVDQLDELFGLQLQPATCLAFCSALLSAAYDASAPVRVVVALREDFIPQLATSPDLRDAVTAGAVWMDPAAPEELHEALTGPLHRLRFELEPGLAEEIIGDLCPRNPGAGPGPTYASREAAPWPLLQLTASRLWERRDDQTRRLLRADLEQLGGVLGVVTSHAEDVLRGLSGRIETQIAREILCALVTSYDTARRESREGILERFADATLAAEVLEHLVRGRLLVSSKADGIDSIELAHEALIQRWDRLAGWLEEEREHRRWRERLAQAAAQWHDEGRRADDLWRGRRLKEALRLTRGHEDQLGTEQSAFLAASRRQAQSRIGRRVAAAVIALASLTFAASLWSQATREKEQEAEAARRLARANALTGTASSHPDPAVGALLLWELRGERPPTAGVRDALRIARRVLPRAVLRGHQEAVLAVAFDPRAARIASASRDATVRLWRADGRGVPVVMRGHRAWVSRVAFSPDGKLLASASEDGTARLWRLDGATSRVLKGHRSAVWHVAFSADGRSVVTASRDREVRVWSVLNTAAPVVLGGHGGEVRMALFSPDGTRVATASDDGTARIWPIEPKRAGKAIVLKGHRGPVRSVAFSPDGRRIVTASVDGSARVWRTDDGAQVLLLGAHRGPLRGARFDGGGGRILTACDDGTARVWRAGDGRLVRVLRGHDGPVGSAVWRPDGSQVLTASEDGTARMWATAPGAPSFVLRGHGGAVTSSAFSADGRWVVTGGQDGTVRVWPSRGSGEPIVLGRVQRAAPGTAGTPTGGAAGQGAISPSTSSPTDGTTVDGTIVADLRGHREDLTSVSLAPDGRSLLTGSFDGTARIWAIGAMGAARVLRGHRDTVFSARFDAGGRRAITASFDGTVRIWLADGTSESIVLRAPRGRLFDARFSRDGSRVATAGEDGTVRIWRSSGPPEIAVLRGHVGWVSSVAFSPDGTQVVTGGEDTSVRLWSLDRAAEPLVLRGHEAPVVTVVFSPDGRRFVSTSDDATARIWSADDSARAVSLRGHTAPIRDASFSASGDRLLTASDDGTARLWRAEDGVLLRVLGGHPGEVRMAAFLPGDRAALTVCDDGSVRRWTLDDPEQSSALGPAQRLPGLEGDAAVRDAHFNHAGDRVVVSHSDGTARIWAVDGTGVPMVLRGHSRPVAHAAFSPDDSLVVTVSEDATARVWRADGRGTPRVLSGHREPVWHASFTLDGQRLATVSRDRTVRVWNLATGAAPLVLEGHTRPVSYVLFSPDGSRVVTSSTDGTVRVWPLDRPGSARVLRHPAPVTSHDVDRRGERVVSAAKDGVVRIWSMRGGAPRELTGHEGPVTWVKFSPDGTRVVSSSVDRTARVWTVEGGRGAVILRGHDGPVDYAAFDPRGRRVVTASRDRTARVWRADGLGEPEVLRGHARAVSDAFFSPDGGRVVTASRDGTARIWRVGWRALLSYLRSATTDCLTSERRTRFLGESPAVAEAVHAECERRFGRVPPPASR